MVGRRVREGGGRRAQGAHCISQTHRGLWSRADTLQGRVGGGHVNQGRARKDIVLTRGQTKQTLMLPRIHVNGTEAWQCSASLPCKVCGKVKEEVGGPGGALRGQIDGDSSANKLEEWSPFFTKLNDRVVLSKIPQPLLSTEILGE